ncbi:lymphocyte antigen 96 isoform X2 [Acinonyx jubatus]|uniref:Lymphocyte antigen 96 isoform X2 n=1 Tax=Acinonyx jubatus TaxID=32536 RepID=A0ABM3NY44_ACIJB|nr:lymphocyte antigen 96 isoform X2 [Acinonyx jubatus]
MFPFILFSTLFSSTFTEPGELQWICNSSDSSVWYSHCDNMKVPISIAIQPCMSMKGSRGYLHLSFIPRRDIKKLYFNLYLSINSMDLPVRKEVICRGSDDVYSFCRALKGGFAMTMCQRTEVSELPQGIYICSSQTTFWPYMGIGNFQARL